MTFCQTLVILRLRRNQDFILKRGSTAHSVTQVNSSISRPLFCSSIRPGLAAILLPLHLHLRVSVLYQSHLPSIHQSTTRPTASSTLHSPTFPYLSVLSASHFYRLLPDRFSRSPTCLLAPTACRIAVSRSYRTALEKTRQNASTGRRCYEKVCLYPAHNREELLLHSAILVPMLPSL